MNVYIGGAARMISRGPEDWHPDPEFVYQYGGGPMFDMGPYYVTALINLLGGIKEVNGFCKASYAERPILSEKKYGNIMQVEVPTYVMGQMRFHSGAIASIFTTFDVSPQSPTLEIYGSEGTISVPDPNCFNGEIVVQRGRSTDKIIQPCIFPYPENSRGLGLADMAKALTTGRLHRANSAQQLHVVEVMSGFYTSSYENRSVTIEAPFERTIPMKKTELLGILD